MHGVAGDELIADLNAPAGGSDFYFVPADAPRRPFNASWSW
jgi:hypothetical protein